MNYDNIPLLHNEDTHRFEIVVDGHTAFIDFKRKEDRIYLIHTEVPAEMEGISMASAMVKKTLSYIEKQQLKLVPSCSYVQSFLKRHSEWNRLL